MTNQTKTFAYVHIASQLLVLLGFILGIFPGIFSTVSVYWVFPLVCVNVIISIVAKDKTLPETLTQVVLAVLSIIPILGSITSLAAIIVSVLVLVECAAILNPSLRESYKNVDEEKDSTQNIIETPELEEGLVSEQKTLKKDKKPTSTKSKKRTVTKAKKPKITA